jgi:hypothetical protein
VCEERVHLVFIFIVKIKKTPPHQSVHPVEAVHTAPNFTYILLSSRLAGLKLLRPFLPERRPAQTFILILFHPSLRIRILNRFNLWSNLFQRITSSKRAASRVLATKPVWQGGWFETSRDLPKELH